MSFDPSNRSFAEQYLFNFDVQQFTNFFHGLYLAISKNIRASPLSKKFYLHFLLEVFMVLSDPFNTQMCLYFKMYEYTQTSKENVHFECKALGLKLELFLIVPSPVC